MGLWRNQFLFPELQLVGYLRYPNFLSRVRFACNGIIASFHRPHPAKEAKRYQVRDARDFLTKSGVVP